MDASKGLIMLTGAPDTDKLDWDEEELLSNLQPPVVRFLEGSESTRPSLQATPTATAHLPKWRSIQSSLDDSQEQIVYHDDTQEEIWHEYKPSGSSKPDQHDQQQFLEHSIAVLDNLDSSQIIASPDATGIEAGTTFVSFATSSFSDTSIQLSDASFLSASPTEIAAARDGINVRVNITDLKRIPSADHILRIQPQTITVNLLVGVIKVVPTRTVRLRRRNAEMDIVEVIVGDDTRAGFSISFWLLPQDSQFKPTDDLREVVRHLRTGTLVLLQNIALSCFHGSVYGQSLNRRFAKNSTAIHMLRSDSALDTSPSFRYKLDLVQQWTANFVGNNKGRMPSSKMGTRANQLERDELPPDTPN